MSVGKAHVPGRKQRECQDESEGQKRAAVASRAVEGPEPDRETHHDDDGRLLRGRQDASRRPEVNAFLGDQISSPRHRAAQSKTWTNLDRPKFGLYQANWLRPGLRNDTQVRPRRLPAIRIHLPGI